MPEGFRYYTSFDSLKQDVFVGNEGETFNITYVKDLPITGGLLSDDVLPVLADILTESVIQQYIDLDIGLSESDFEREGTFSTEAGDRDWIGINFNASGVRYHQCMTFDGEGNMLMTTFTGMDPKDEETVLNTFNTSLSIQTEDIFGSSDNRESTSGSEYTLMDGKMKVVIPPEYDVLIKNTTLITDEIAASHGTSADKLETWLSLQGNDLVAVEKGGLLDGSSDEIGIRIKTGSYEGVDNFKDYPDSLKELLAEPMVSGFQGTNGYQLYETEDACFIVFEPNMLGEEIRYATIVDENMIYLIYKPESGTVTDEMRDTLRRIADTVRF